MSAIAYARISVADPKRKSESVESQRQRIYAYAEANDIAISEFVPDVNVSGKDLKRSGIMYIINEIREGRCKTLIVCKLDRLSRSLADFEYTILPLIMKEQVALLSLDDAVNTSTASGRFVLRVQLATNQYEREIIAERTRTAMAHLKSTGRKFGKGVRREDKVA